MNSNLMTDTNLNELITFKVTDLIEKINDLEKDFLNVKIDPVFDIMVLLNQEIYIDNDITGSFCYSLSFDNSQIKIQCYNRLSNKSKFNNVDSFFVEEFNTFNKKEKVETLINFYHFINNYQTMINNAYNLNSSLFSKLNRLQFV